MPPVIDHIEKTLADAYRKEIDQEENIWRSLPFFAAALAFQMTALSLVLSRLPEAGTGVWLDAVGAIVLMSLCIMAVLGFLALSITPERFTYVADEPALLAYALDLEQDERDAREQEMAPVEAVDALKRTLADQYAVAAHGNRRINQRRALYRSFAGLAMLGSVFFTAFLIIRVMLHHMPHDN